MLAPMAEKTSKTFFINIKQKCIEKLNTLVFWHEVYFRVNGNEVIITSNFRSLASAFDKKIFKIISIIDTALALIKYIAQLFFNKTKLVQSLLIRNTGKLWYLSFKLSAFYSYIGN